MFIKNIFQKLFPRDHEISNTFLKDSQIKSYCRILMEPLPVFVIKGKGSFFESTKCWNVKIKMLLPPSRKSMTGVKTMLLVCEFQRMHIFRSISEYYSHSTKIRDVFGAIRCKRYGFILIFRLIHYIYFYCATFWVKAHLQAGY